MRVPRQTSRSGYYHVVIKGDGGQALFEDDADRRTFLRLAGKYLAGAGVSVIAWCLMENHVHLVLRDDAEGLSAAMHRLGTAYARHYNDRTGRVGHLFRERFMSSPIESESYLLEAVRYVHNNPEKAGLCRAEEYPWSSYGSYAAPGSSGELSVDTAVVLDRVGGEKGFAEFVAARGDISPVEVKNQPVERRNQLLRELRAAGLSVRQIERLTGVGRNIVARA